MIGRSAAGTLLAVLLALASSAPAGAAEETPNHPFLGSLVGGLTGQPRHSLLEDPCGVAVTPQGDLYVSDYYHHQVGLWEHTLGSYGPVLEDVATPNGPCGLAVDPAGTLYINHWHGAVTNADGEVIAPGPATGIAVDPASGDLYVDERTSVAVYEAPIVPGEPPALRIGTGSLLDGYGVAVSAFGETAGEVYVADAATHTVKVYDPAAPEPDSPVRIIDGAGTAQGGFVSLVDSSLAIDQSNGHLFVADNTQPGFEHPRAAIDEFNAEGLYHGALEKLLIHGGPVGIAVNEAPGPANGYVYVTTGNGTSHVFPTAEGPPVSEQSFVYAFGPAGTALAAVSDEFVPEPVLPAVPSAQGVATLVAAPAGPAATTRTPKRARHRFARGKSIALRAHRRSKEKR